MESRHIEIMDTTLRDGEQTSGVSFMPHEKLMIARALLQDLNVDRIEVASARVSEGEKEFEAIVVNGDADDYLYPCGVCRQVMVEFCDLNEFKVIVANNEDDYKVFTLGELMPGAFDSKELEKGQQ